MSQASPKSVTLIPIGTVRASRKDAVDDHWSTETAAVELDASRFSPDALAGLDAFSHVEVIFLMDGVAEADVETGARHPRNDPSLAKVGIFAQRAKRRPNRLGLSRCRILSISGLAIQLADLDAIDGTPVLDLKPWVREFGPRGADPTQPAWITDLMKAYY